MRQKNAVWGRKRKLGKVTKDMIHKECPDVSMTTIERTLANMLAQGRIEKVDGGRSTGYVVRHDAVKS